MITVHSFKVYDFQRDEFVVPERKSPAARIEQAKGTIIPGTAEDVDEAELDAQGRYDPRKKVRNA